MLCCHFLCRGGVVDSTLEWFDPARRNAQKSPGSGPRMGEIEFELFLLNCLYPCNKAGVGLLESLCLCFRLSVCLSFDPEIIF